jgi:hypothetical protein
MIDRSERDYTYLKWRRLQHSMQRCDHDDDGDGGVVVRITPGKVKVMNKERKVSVGQCPDYAWKGEERRQ